MMNTITIKKPRGPNDLNFNGFGQVSPNEKQFSNAGGNNQHIPPTKLGYLTPIQTKQHSSTTSPVNLPKLSPQSSVVQKNDSLQPPTNTSHFKKALSCDTMESDSGMRKFEERLKKKKESEEKFMSDEAMQSKILEMWKSTSPKKQPLKFSISQNNNNYIPTAQKLLNYQFPRGSPLNPKEDVSYDSTSKHFKKTLSDTSMQESSAEFTNFLGFLESIQALIFLRGLKVAIKSKCKEMSKDTNWNLRELTDPAASFALKETAIMFLLEKAKVKYPCQSKYLPELTDFLFKLIERETTRPEQRIVKALGVALFLKKKMKKLKLENNIVSPKKGKKKDVG